MAERTRRIESGEQIVVGVNRFTETAPSPLGGEDDDPAGSTPRCEAEMIADVQAWRAEPRRRRGRRGARRAAPGRPTATRTSCRPRSPWPTPAAPPASGPARCARCSASTAPRPASPRPPVGRRAATACAAVAERVEGDARRPAAVPRRQARPRRPLQRRRADRRRRPRRRHGGRLLRASASRPSRSPPSARDEDVDVIGLSILSGSHLELVPEVVRLLRAEGVDAPVVVGGIIPEDDRPRLLGRRRRRGLHAQGLRARPDHGRDRRPRRRRTVGAERLTRHP